MQIERGRKDLTVVGPHNNNDGGYVQCLILVYIAAYQQKDSSCSNVQPRYNIAATKASTHYSLNTIKTKPQTQRLATYTAHAC
jgi:hypothetical protein